MARFDQMSKEELSRITSMGGKASAKARSEKKTFEQIVNENITEQDLIELYQGMLEAGKKGKVKAIMLLLRYLKGNDLIENIEEIWENKLRA